MQDTVLAVHYFYITLSQPWFYNLFCLLLLCQTQADTIFKLHYVSLWFYYFFASCFLRKTLAVHYFYITLRQPLILELVCLLLFCARRWLYTVFLYITMSCVSIYNAFSYGKSLNLHYIGCTLFSYDNWLRHYFRPYSAVRCHLSREPISSRRFFFGVPIALGFLYLPYYTGTWPNILFVIDLRIRADSVLSTIAWLWVFSL